jgi:hypothetical protein
MDLFYAMGGGLGHLCRINALIHTLGIINKRIITNSAFAPLVFESDEIINVSADYYHKPRELAAFIETVIYRFNVADFYIDTFPAGMIGELNYMRLKTCRLMYIARLLNPESGKSLMKDTGLNYHHTFQVEEIHSQHKEFINKHSVSISEISLIYPAIKEKPVLQQVLANINCKPWIIVHSGPTHELEILYRHALDISSIHNQKPLFLILTQVKDLLPGNDIVQLNYFPAVHFFPFAEKIFTACGFNSMYQTRQYAEIHHFIPFDRKYDDQFERARLRRNMKDIKLCT